jgi:adenosine deaminase
MNLAFQTALEMSDLPGLRACPKADRHVHGIGGGSRDYLRTRTGRDIGPVDRVLSSMADMHAWASANFGDLFDGAAGRAVAFEATFAQARLDGVTLVEFGEDAWAITLHDGDAEALWSGLQDAHRRGGPDVKWTPQLEISRHCPITAIERWAAPLLELGVFQALDLSGDEFAQPIEVFQPIYRRAKAAGLRLKAHVGEWGTADDVLRAVEGLELDEVQHGIAAARSPAAMASLAVAGVRLNLCPTSNLKLGRVANLADHPIRSLYDAGVKVTVNTDDPLIFGTSLSEEFLALFKAGVMTAAELDAIRLGALE